MTGRLTMNLRKCLPSMGVVGRRWRAKDPKWRSPRPMPEEGSGRRAVMKWSQGLETETRPGACPAGIRRLIYFVGGTKRRKET